MPPASSPPPSPIPPTPLQQPSGIGARNIHNKDIHVKSKNFRAFKSLFLVSLIQIKGPHIGRTNAEEKKQMKEGKFTLRAEKQMVQRVGWSGGCTAEEGPGATPQKPWQTFNLRRTFPPRKNQGGGGGWIFISRVLFSKQESFWRSCKWRCWNGSL